MGFFFLCFWIILIKIFLRFQHTTICILELTGLLIVGISNNIFLTIIGVSIASMGGGLGEVCYIALTSYYSKFILNLFYLKK